MGRMFGLAGDEHEPASDEQQARREVSSQGRLQNQLAPLLPLLLKRATEPRLWKGESGGSAWVQLG